MVRSAPDGSDNKDSATQKTHVLFGNLVFSVASQNAGSPAREGTIWQLVAGTSHLIFSTLPFLCS